MRRRGYLLRDDIVFHHPLKTQFEIDSEKLLKEHQRKMEIRSRINKFMTAGIITITISIIGFLLFVLFDFNFINPILYILGFIMGLGWTITAIASLIEYKRKYN